MAKYVVTRSDGRPIPEDEPCFVIRGQDAFAIKAIDAYIELTRGVVTPEVTRELEAHRGRLVKWRTEYPIKLPD
jgi:hypothetical protein